MVVKSTSKIASGAKSTTSPFSKAGIRLSWIGDDFETDFWVFFGGFLDSILSTIWPGLACLLKCSETWIDDVTTKVVENDISKSVLSRRRSPHVNIFYCMGGLGQFPKDSF
jgi:hypothetical protein